MRAVVLCTAVLFGFVVAGLRLAELMLMKHEGLSHRARKQQLARRELEADRGYVFDRRGRKLAVNVDAVSVYTNPKDVEDRKATAKALCEYTGENCKGVLRKISTERSFVWIKRKLDADKGRQLMALNLKGVGFFSELKRFYPKGQLASHVLGFVGIDNQALEGIELKYDEYLHGNAHEVLYSRDAGGRRLSDGLELQSLGSSIVLTLDEGLQYIVERELEKTIAIYNASAGIAVMMDPHTGDILAMGNRPTFDLNEPSDSLVGERRNRAITDPYEPGSTFKLITASALLDEGAVSLNTEFDASAGYIVVGGKPIYDTHPKGTLTFSEVIKRSSNVGTILASRLLNDKALYSYMKGFGFGHKTGIDLPGENPGFVRQPSEWSETSHAAMSIGYEVMVTPLQVLTAYSVVANGGRTVTPHVVSEILSPEGAPLYSHASQGNPPRQVISEKTAATLRNVLVTVTETGGTAEAAYIEGSTVAGKTGTTKLLDPSTGKYSRDKYVSSFVGFVPADRPKFALIVVVYEPEKQYYGGQVAAPAFKRIAEQSLSYLNLPQRDYFDEETLFVKSETGRYAR